MFTNKSYIKKYPVEEVTKTMNNLCIALLLTVATASVASNGEPEVPSIPRAAEQGDCEFDDDACLMETVPESRTNLVVGAISPNSRQLAWMTHRVNPSTFLIHEQDITFRGPKFTNITAMWVYRIGNSQNARPTIIAGGLGHEFVTVRILGARGQGFDYNIYIDGAINCSNS
ncbi:hypothetical protein PYW08_009248 [Mythimna loreyi]|uniref:Uncharacterized protein n=1 Tax=Mythimna loreyi TaxID=667449 RepID=A0ACC2Q887_9NEOP|nr:hypothetical protein PYW08_009248 [Mythimna loreyi]